MTPRQIRLSVALSALMALSVAGNMLLMQPQSGRAERPDRPYRGLAALPGTHSTARVEATRPEHSDSEAKSNADQGVAARLPTDAPADANLIRAVQAALAQRGYVHGGNTGTLDVVTRAAIMAFEHDRSLALTAEPSRRLLAELQSDVPIARPMRVAGRPGREAEEIIRTVQQSLARLSYQPGPADGLPGDATRAAIIAFERDQRLPESGRVSGLLLTRLAEQAAAGRLATR